MTAFDQIVASLEEQYHAVNDCKSLTGLQAIRIWQTQIDGYSHVGEILRDGIQDQVNEHASSLMGSDYWESGQQEVAKMHFENAEISVTAEYAYQIYLAVKAVIDKGDDLT